MEYSLDLMELRLKLSTMCEYVVQTSRCSSRVVSMGSEQYTHWIGSTT